MSFSLRHAVFKAAFTRQTALLLIVLIYLFQALWHFDKPVAPDVVQIYLPLAQKVLNQGVSFFFMPESIIAPPVAYLWPSLFGANLTVIKLVNVASGIFMVLLTYGIGQQLHSRLVGVIAAFLFAISPFIVRWIPTALSEPPFYLYTLVWLWGMGEVITEKKWAIPVSAIALSLSILTRGIWFYPSIVILFFVLALFVFKPSARKISSNIAAALALGLAIPILVIVKNIVLFGVPTIETGSGGALFLGTSIWTNGFEPPLLGLTYDLGSVGFKTALGNREHGIVAMHFLNERSLSELLDWYLTKVSWVTLFTDLEAPKFASVWRVLELSVALIGVWQGWRQRSAYVLLLAGGLVLQILQTAFPLYNIRYSIDGLELLLIPLAAVGAAAIFNIKKKTAIKKQNHEIKKNFFQNYEYGIAAISIASVLFVILCFRITPSINLPQQIPISVLFDDENMGRINNSLIVAGEEGKSVRRAELSVAKQTLPAGVGSALWKIRMVAQPSAGGGCSKSSASFHTTDSFVAPILRNAEAIGSSNSTVPISHWMSFVNFWFKSIQNRSAETGEVYFKLYNDGEAHTYLLGAAVSGAELFPVEAGKLILKFECSSDVKIAIDQIALLAPHFIETYFHTSPVNAKR